MRVLVVGSGGREHALVWKLAQEATVFCTPGNPGIATDCETFDVAQTDTDGLISLAKRLGVDFVLIGPENPLIDGLADDLRAAGVAVFGPGRTLAQFEGDKAWSKEQMLLAAVPTAAHGTFDDVELAKAYTAQRFAEGKGVAVKATGAAFGKGVVVCDRLEPALDALDMMMVRRELGEAGRVVVIEDRLVGKEFSLLTLVSGGSFWSLPVAQDYKRALDGDRGDNTGGMGSYSPVSWLSEGLVQAAENRIARPIIEHLLAAGHDYRGVLFSGVMVENGQPYCLEYNVRFGDPEIQSVVMRLGEGFASSLEAIAKGGPVVPIPVKDVCVNTVVIASGGYPNAYHKGFPITIGALPEGGKVFHSGTKQVGNELQTNGGRVLAISAVAGTADSAREASYQAASQISFEGKQLRTDIGL